MTAVVLATLVVPVSVVALIDPLEGGLALLAAIVLTVIVHVVSRVPIPRLELVGMIAAVVVGAMTLIILALASGDVGSTAVGVTDRLDNPLGAGASALSWVYRVAVVIAIAGAVQYLVRLVRQARVTREPAR